MSCEVDTTFILPLHMHESSKIARHERLYHHETEGSHNETKGGNMGKGFIGKGKTGKRASTPHNPKHFSKPSPGHPPNLQLHRPTNHHEPTTILNTTQTKTRVVTGKGKTSRGNQKGKRDKRERETPPRAKTKVKKKGRGEGDMARRGNSTNKKDYLPEQPPTEVRETKKVDYDTTHKERCVMKPPTNFRSGWRVEH